MLQIKGISLNHVSKHYIFEGDILIMRENKDFSELRREYKQPSFDIDKASPNPIEQFDFWLKDISKTKNPEINAMTLATVGKSGFPSIRVVLLKGIENGNFIFYTNYSSQKGIDIKANPKVALNFYWPELSRQVRIEGIVEKVAEVTSEKYFNSRPRGSQIGAWTSPQSAVLQSRKPLEERYKQMEEKFKGKEIPKPKQWGGYSVTPLSLEFWQGRENRLHDRLLYIPQPDKSWKIERLAP